MKIGSPTEIILPINEEYRINEFRKYLDKADRIIQDFALDKLWTYYTQAPFLETIVVFSEKKYFDQKLIEIYKLKDQTIPEAYCGFIEKKTLYVMTPEYYSEVYPQGIEQDSYTKLIAHEIAHQLHIRLLDGNEDAMGPIWFYEGFATIVADQFVGNEITMENEEIVAILTEKSRGDYRKYNRILNKLTERIELIDLVNSAKSENFVSWIIEQVN